MEVTKHTPGMLSWADLATTDLEESRSFYTRILGLDSTDNPVGEGVVYLMLSKNGKSSCAIYEMSAEMKEQTGGHPAWMSYFTVESADDTASKARSLGGRLLDEPFDVMDAGRMAVVQDPTGAVFAVWEPRNSIGSEVFGEPGALAWAELYTRDTGAATQFYTELFGWAVNKHPGADGREYTEYHIEDRSAAGMLEIRKEWGEMPAHWAVYLAVADLDATLAQAKGMGATEVMPPMEVEGVGRFVFVQDPQGAYVALMQISASRISGAAS